MTVPSRGPRLLAAVLAGALLACGADPARIASRAADRDPLGPRPVPLAPAPFVPPVPTVWQRPGGLTVWLLERHALPIVSLQLVMRAGSAADPLEQGGLAYQTANMLDEGAGTRGPLEIASEIDRLGADLSVGVNPDYAVVELTALAKNLAPAAAIFGDVVTRPRFSQLEWKRVHDLWENALRARQSQPSAVARLVASRQVYGAGHPYGHPADGTLRSAAKVGLADVKKFYAQHWRADRATLVVVGDVSRGELDPLLDQVLGGLSSSGAAAAPARPAAPLSEPSRRVILVDRADAPQSVIVLARPGVAAADAHSELTRANAALGGSFTSRLNQDLREDHGWAYGAASRFSFAELPGLFTASAAVQTEHTGEALQAMLTDVETFAKQGLTAAEVEKTRVLARADLVDQFAGVQSAAARLAADAGVGLPADHAARASERLYSTTKQELDALIARHMDPANAAIVIVGPRAQILPQLESIGITSVESSGPEAE